jgi:hypothetical protein
MTATGGRDAAHRAKFNGATGNGRTSVTADSQQLSNGKSIGRQSRRHNNRVVTTIWSFLTQIMSQDFSKS